MNKDSVPLPVVIGKGQMRSFDVNMWETDVKQTAEYLFKVIRDMTKSHLEVVKCPKLEQALEKNEPSFVYFGSEELLKEGQMLEHLNMVASFDKQNNPNEQVRFFAVHDPECAKKLGIENVAEPAIRLYMHKNFRPFTIQGKEEDMSFERLVTWITMKYVQTNLDWGDRAYQVVNLMKNNAIFYLVPSLGSEPDWLAQLMGITAGIIREQIDGIILIIASYDDETKAKESIFDMMGIKSADELPGIYFFHGVANEVRKWNDPIVEYELSPDMILMWSRLQMLDSEVSIIDRYIQSLEHEENVEEDLIETYTKLMEEAAEERDALIPKMQEAHTEIREATKQWLEKQKQFD